MNEEYELDDVAPWLLLIITLVGGVLRVMLLGTKGMWLDETFSVWLANQDAGELLQWIARIDQHPPLYYLLLHAWTAVLGDAPYEARLLSALFGAATIPLIYLIGSRLSGVGVGLAAALFLAVSPFNIYFAQETRMYTLLAFNAAAAIYALVRLLTDARAADRPIGSQLREHLRDRRMPLRGIETDLAWAALIVFSAATVLTHNTAVFFLLATNLFVLGLWLYQRIRKPQPPLALQAPSLANWVKAQLGVLLLWSPWLVVFVRQAGGVYREFWIPPPTFESVTQTLRSLLSAAAPGQASQAIMLGFLGLVLALGLVYYRNKLSIFFLLLTLFAVPFLGELLVSIVRPIFYGRTLIWITIPLLLLLAAGVVQLRFRLLVIVVLGMIAGNYLFAVGDYYRFYQKEDWSTPAGYVANFAEQGDLVLFNSNFVVIPFNYYFEFYEDRYGIEVVKQGVPRDLVADGVLEPKMTAGDIPALEALVRGHERVWLVYSHDSYTDPEGLVPQTLAAQMELLREREFYGGRVQLYGAP